MPTLALLVEIPGRAEAYHDKGAWVVLLVTALFVAAEPLVFHVESRNEAVSFSPTDLPLALGLLMLSPLSLVAARIVGSGIGLLIWRRPPLFKLTLNLAAFSAESLVATLVLRSLFPELPAPSPILWLGMIAALMVGLLVAGIVIATAISFFEGDTGGRVRKELSHTYLFYLPGAVLGASFAMPTLVEPWLLLMFAAPAPLVWLILRSHGNLMHRFADLSGVHEFSRQVGRSSHLEEIADTAVGEIAAHMRAQSVALIVWGNEAGPVTASLGSAALRDALPATLGDAPWAHEFDTSEPVLVDAAQGTDARGKWLLDHGIDQALVAVLQPEGRPVGVLVVSERQGAADRFDEDDLTRLQPISDQLAVALRKGQLHVQIQHEATHDQLTGLPNRPYFEAWLDETSGLAGSDKAAVLVIDLDGFKEVNDTLGHHAGDELLEEVGRRLTASLEGNDLAARFGGDEFAIVAAGAGEDEALLLAEKISQGLEEPFEIRETSIAIAASIGIALAPDHGSDSTSLLRRADLAMYDAKRCHARSTVYSTDLEGQDSVRLAMLGDLRENLRSGALDVHFQPKLDLSTGQVVSVEALARWEHPVHKVGPDVFIGLAEHAGLIEELTEFVLGRSLRAASHWRELGYEIGVAVNLSPRSLLNEGLPGVISDQLQRLGVPGPLLTIEITEQSVIGDLDRTTRILEELNELGVRISIDDFGTGHSSLVNLRYLPISELKIDQSFVAEMLLGRNDEVIVKSTIDLGHNLGFEVVAEGVETTDIQERLKDLGCDLAQGYGICRPLPVEELDRWLTNARPRRAPGFKTLADLELRTLS